MVITLPPRTPSIVFFFEIEENIRFPKSFPETKANVSFTQIKEKKMAVFVGKKVFSSAEK